MKMRQIPLFVALLCFVSAGFVFSGGAKESSAGSSQGGAVTIKWLLRSDMGPKISSWEQTEAAAYQKQHPNVTIDSIASPWADYNTKLLTMAAGGDIPDVFANFAAGFGTFVNRGVVQDLLPYVKKAQMDLPKVLSPSAISALTIEGKLYGLPFDNQPTLVFFNKTLFEKYGVPLPPTSWEDKSWTIDVMTKDAQAIAHVGKNPTDTTWGLVWTADQLACTSWLWNGDPFAPTGGPTNSVAYKGKKVTETYFTRPEVVAAMEWYAGLANKLGVSPNLVTLQALQQVSDPFASGKVGMYVGGGWEFENLLATQPDFQWGVAPIPYGPGGYDTLELWTDAWSLGKGSKNSDAAFEFMQFLTQGAPAAAFATITGYLAADLSLIPDQIHKWSQIPGFAQDEATLTKVVNGGLETQHSFEAPGHLLADYSQLNTIWTNASANFVNGKQSVVDGLKQVQADMAKQIAQTK